MSDREDSRSPMRSRSRSPRDRSNDSGSKRYIRENSYDRRDRGRYRSRSKSLDKYKNKYSSRSRSRSRSYERKRSNSRSPSLSKRTNGKPDGKYTHRRCLGVFGLSIYTSEKQITEIFSKFGTLERVQVIYDAKTGRSRGYCFVYFQKHENAKVACDQCTGMELDGRRIRVAFSITQRPHTPTPGVYMGRATKQYRKERDRYNDRDRYRYKGDSDRDRRRNDRPRRRSPSPYSRDRRRRFDRRRSPSFSPRNSQYKF